MKRYSYVPLVRYCSFDQDTPVWLFDTEEEAIEELKKQLAEEFRIDTEENGHKVGVDGDMEVDCNFDMTWASITIYWNWYDKNGNPERRKDVTKWSIGHVVDNVNWQF